MKKILTIIAMFVLVLPVFALDCNKKPCHSKCINLQPSNVEQIMESLNIMPLVMGLLNNML